MNKPSNPQSEPIGQPATDRPSSEETLLTTSTPSNSPPEAATVSPEPTTTSSEPAATSPKPPTLKPLAENPITMSSPPEQLSAAHRPGLPPPKASGLTSDMAAKMKAFSLSRQRAPAHNMRSPQLSASGPSDGPRFSGGPVTASMSRTGGMSPIGALGAGNVPAGAGRPQPQNWASSPQVGAAARPAPRLAMGGLAAKRGIKGGGMKLSDATGTPPPSSPGGAGSQSATTGSNFDRYADLVDTKGGTLNFKNKAVIHSGGIDFDSGLSFSISLDEVDTLEELGKGNYGTVYKVRHSRPKMRKPGQGLRGNMNTRQQSTSSISSTDSAASAPATTGTGIVMAMKEVRFELEDSRITPIITELDILQKCISPFIVSFYGAFFQEGSVYICLEYMDGGSVDKLYGDGIPEPILKKISVSTVVGLKFLKEEHNIIHRDVKPTNILLNTRGQVKICDFGVSGKLVASIARTNIGCQSYMAPERISGGGIAQTGANPDGSYSAQSDVWSLGLTIIECAMGRYPYPPDTYNNIFSQLSAIVDGDPPDLPPDGYSDAARSFVSACLHKVPKMRPTYPMLLRHAWLSPLMKPPTISEDGEGEAAAEAGAETPHLVDGALATADHEVAEWVKAAMEKKMNGLMGKSQKPALHAVFMDAIPATSGVDQAVTGQDTIETAPPADAGGDQSATIT